MNINIKVFVIAGSLFGVVMGLYVAREYGDIPGAVYGVVGGIAFGLYAGHSVKKKK